MSARITLTATAGPLIGRHFSYDAPILCTIGRSHDCVLQLPNNPADLSASRHHCEIVLDEPEAAVRDLGSTNGTYVNGAEVGGLPPGRLLHDGDRLRVGSSVFHVTVESVPDQWAVCSSKCETHR
jgi:pSer/pThr/pTyr-binding forkhead associated (FHA) protein